MVSNNMKKVGRKGRASDNAHMELDRLDWNESSWELRSCPKRDYFPGSIGRASGSRFYEISDLSSNPSEAQETSVSSSESNMCADSLSVCPTPVCMRMHKNDHVRTLKIM